MDPLSKKYGQVFQSPEGQSVLADLGSVCNFLRSSYSPVDPSDATAFREGQRSVFLHILSQLQQVDQDYLTLAQRLSNQLVSDQLEFFPDE